MKTAISLPDALFEAAEAAARRLGLSRSRFYAEAIETYLKQGGAAGITDRLDEVYGESDSRLDDALAQLQFASLPSEEW